MNTRISGSEPLGASFRDPSGFLFTRDGILYRQVNQAYRENYDHLMSSGLYQNLVEAGLLVPHEEEGAPAGTPAVEAEQAYKILRPERVRFISYPYEWSFSELKDAALATLAIQKQALGSGMSLKDASAYNIQFYRGCPALIDSLSFEVYREGEPWVAYRQFCQHFLAPLSLMSYRDVRLGQLLRVFIDGIPLDLASRLLPARTRLAPSLLLHIHLHATAQKRYAGDAPGKTTDKPDTAGRKMNKVSFLGLIDSLESGIRKLRWSPEGTEWGDYYEDTNYSPAGLQQKKALVQKFIEQARPAEVWDLGANTGLFSRLASDAGIPTVAFDVDPAAVEKNYKDCTTRGERNLLPLLLDLTNPSPAAGWHNRERMSLVERGPTGMVLALALVHHLAISNNVPLDRLAAFFADLCNWLVIEFVPKGDSQVQRLLSTRLDIFPGYTEENFERVFAGRFVIHEREAIPDSQRRLYLMEKRA